MQGDLISRKELIEMIEGTEELLDFQKDECIVCINACDVAYSVEKVIAELEEYYGEAEQFGVEGIITDIVDVVRNGGKE